MSPTRRRRHRHSEMVALVISPAASMVSGAALLELLARLPRPDDWFGDDVRALAELTVYPSEPSGS